MSRKLETATNIAILLTCVLASTVLVRKLNLFRLGNNNAIYALKTGDVIPPPWGVRPRANETTVVAVVRSTCRFCTASIPFYREVMLTGRRASSSRPVRFVVVSDETSAVTAAYLSSHGLSGAQIISAPAATLRVAGTPTLLVVDESGIIRDRRVGQLSLEMQREFLHGVVHAN